MKKKTPHQKKKPSVLKQRRKVKAKIKAAKIPPVEKDKGGRPRIWDTPEALQEQIDQYYAWAKREKKPLTIERLAVFLDVDRQTILNYGKDDKFFGTVKKARDYVLASKMDMLNSLGGVKTGIIFDLKNNHGFVDRQELKTELSINQIFIPEKDGN